MAMSSENEAVSDTEVAVPLLREEDGSPPPYTRIATHDTPAPQLEIDDKQERNGKIIRRLYTSHFLSTWNSRTFEFATLLFIASIWKDTLLPVSIFAISRALSAIVLAGEVGHMVDHKGRLSVVRSSIVCQRVAVMLWLLLFIPAKISAFEGSRSTNFRVISTFVSLMFLIPISCIEKFWSITNLVAIERDWVIVIAENTECSLDVLNSQMRRIDLACKLLGPLFIALIDGWNTYYAMGAIFIMNFVGFWIELFAIHAVYRMVPALASGKSAVDNASNDAPNDALPASQIFFFDQPIAYCLRPIHLARKSLSEYSHHAAFLPSLALSLLYFTVLSFSGQMITYLLSISGSQKPSGMNNGRLRMTEEEGSRIFSTAHIGLMRTLASTFEMIATWLAPAAMKRIGPTRAGLWSISWQATCTVAAISMFWSMHPASVSALGLVAGVVLSRVGLWSFDLCVQIIVQETVEAPSRGSFSSFEASLQNFFEICAYASTIIFADPAHFRYPVLMSGIVVLISWALYAEYVRRTRGHLVHLSKCLEGKKGPVGGRRAMGRSLRLRELP